MPTSFDFPVPELFKKTEKGSIEAQLKPS